MKIGFGLVGTGHMAHEHAKAILKIPNARLIAVRSKDAARAEEFARKYGIKAYADYNSFLENSNINIVDITSEHYLHSDHGVLAAKHKKHILVEKPIDISLEKADWLIKTCKQNNVNLFVMSQYKSGKAVKLLKHAIDSGKLGKIALAHISLRKNRSQSYYDSSGGWRKDIKKSGGGVLLLNGVHYIDILLWLLGPVKDACAKIATLTHDIGVEDTAAGVLRFESGALGTVSFTTSVLASQPDRLEIHGSKGSVILENDRIIAWNFSKNPFVNLLASLLMRLRYFKRPSIHEQMDHCIKQIQNTNQSEAEANMAALKIILDLYRTV